MDTSNNELKTIAEMKQRTHTHTHWIGSAKCVCTAHDSEKWESATPFYVLSPRSEGPSSKHLLVNACVLPKNVSLILRGAVRSAWLRNAASNVFRGFSFCRHHASQVAETGHQSIGVLCWWYLSAWLWLWRYWSCILHGCCFQLIYYGLHIIVRVRTTNEWKCPELINYRIKWQNGTVFPAINQTGLKSRWNVWRVFVRNRIILVHHHAHTQAYSIHR